MKTFRIALGGFIHETNTFSQIPTTYDDFRILRGQALLQERLGSERPENVESFPSIFARGLPSGLVRRAAYERIKEELLNSFRSALPLDGIYLDLHGAMEVEEVGDAEGDFVRAVREMAGPDVLISVSLDLHGNISPNLVDSANILTAYRTAPHRDDLETRQRAFGLLVSSLRSQWKPVSALIKIPLLLPGEAAVTQVEPARSLYGRLSEIDRMSGVLVSSLLFGCPWTDSLYTTASVIVSAREERELAEEQARALAREVWARREDFRLWGEVASIEESVRTAMAASERPVFISDSGDNITAGAPGDLPLIAGCLIDRGARDALVAGLTDRAAVEACSQAGEGKEAIVEIGGKLDREHATPLRVRGQVEYLISDEGGEAAMALLRVDGVRILLLVDRRFLIDRLGIARGGVDPMKQKIVVVKQGYLFPDLYDHAPKAIMALSPGTTDLRLERLAYRNVPRPVYPLDRNLAWRI